MYNLHEVSHVGSTNKVYSIFQLSETKQPQRNTKRKHQATDELAARCKRVQNQLALDNEAHAYLMKKLKHEASLAHAQEQMAKAEEERKIQAHCAEEERRKVSFENEQRFLEEKRKLQLKLLQEKHDHELKMIQLSVNANQSVNGNQ